MDDLEIVGAQTYKAAIVGCGRMAHAHAEAYALDDRVDLVACADVSPKAANRLGEEFYIRARYRDYREMLVRERPDVVSICTHHQLHAVMTVEATHLAAPKAILCEKPIALDLSSADEMIAACQDSGTLLLIGHQRRFARQYTATREALVGGRIGEVISVEAFGHPAASLLVDSTHTIDLVRFFLDDPVGEWVIGQIDARSHRVAWGQPVEDCALGWIRLQNGVHVLLGVGSSPWTHDRNPASLSPTLDWNYHCITLHGSTGRLEVDGDAPYDGRPLVRIHRGSEVEVVFSADDYEASRLPSAVALEVRAMLDCLDRPGLRHPLEAPSARATLEILLAIYESARRRQLIPLPLEVRDNPLISMLEQGAV